MQTYIPHIATVIQEGNIALASGTPLIRGAKHINLESMMVSNPRSVRLLSCPLLALYPSMTLGERLIDDPQDALSHYRWVLQQNCIYTDYFNATLCHSGYAQLPECLERVQFAYENGSARARSEAGEMCDKALRIPVAGRSQENVELHVRSFRFRPPNIDATISRCLTVRRDAPGLCTASRMDRHLPQQPLHKTQARRAF